MSDSPCDDSDIDPDYDPNVTKKRKTFHFNFEDDDSEEELKSNAKNYDFVLSILHEILDQACIKVSGNSKGTRRTTKYDLLPPCQDTCRRKCYAQYTNTRRQEIFDHFSKLNFGEKRLFIDSLVKQQGVKVKVQEASISTRNFSLLYFLPTPNAADNIVNEVQVCKTMFLHTLGMKTDGTITSHFKTKRNSSGNVKTLDERGAAARGIKTTNKLKTEDKVIQHINSYHPVVSHYNLNHAPNRRYLPSELTIMSLWKDFCQENFKISYEVYRKIFEKQNIGFVSPTQDECETCSKFEKYHDQSSAEHNMETCMECKALELHKQRYTDARKYYQEDKEQQSDSNVMIYSVDMQKVLILPKMSIKNSYFVSRCV